MRGDVLRLEILHRYGGIYADIDSVALRSFGRRAGLEMQTIILNNPRSSLFRELSDIHKDTKGKELFLYYDEEVTYKYSFFSSYFSLKPGKKQLLFCRIAPRL